MKIKGVNRQQLEDALTVVNDKYEGNIGWKRIEALNRAGTRWTVTIRCHSSKAPGHSISYNQVLYGGNPRRLTSACWHVHGTFLDALPVGIEIRTRGQVTYSGAEWEDFNVGSVMFPRYASESCECERG